MGASVDDSLDELYAAPLGEFIARRDAHAKELKKAGDRAGAEQLAKAKRPAVAAWAVNQVVRAHPEARDELIEAGAQLRQAQSALLSGGDAQAFRGASDRLHAAVRHLTELAGKVAGAAGHADSSSVLGRIERTLFTSATGDALGQELLLKGRFVGDLAPADPLAHGGWDGLAAGPPPAPKAAPKPAAAPREDKAQTLARKEAEQEAARLEALARQVEKDAAKATRRAEALDQAAKEAEASAAVATARAVQARQAAAEAKVEALGLDAKVRASAQEAANARSRVGGGG